jgi:alpha-glucosidase
MTNETEKETENFEMDEEIAVKEKLHPKGDSASPSKVKFTAAIDGKNGDAKVDVENGYRGSVGMSKEELMKYANDPFWVRLRMFLFILFWVVWIAMLIGAIVIIAVAPKCPPTSSLPWWQKTTIYQVYVRSFKDSNGDGEGDIRGLINKLDYFKDIGVDTLILSPIYPSPMKDSGYDVTNYIDIDPRYGSLADFDELVDKLHKPEKDMKVIIDFIPNHTSDKHPWFEASKRNDTKFADYYVWRDPSVTTGERKPPNNWKSVFGGSAWTWNEERKQYYLHQFYAEQPDLNLRNPEVKTALKEVLQFWMRRKVDGIRIDAVSHLFEDEDFSDEVVIQGKPLKDDDYDSLEHNKTKAQPENYGLIEEWRKIVKQAGLKKIVISEAYEPTEQLIKYYGTNKDPLVDLPFNFQLIDFNLVNNASVLKEKIESWITTTKDYWPSDAKPPGPWSAWVTGNHDRSRLASRLGHKLADAILMLTFLLPRNTPVVYYGDEIGMTDHNMAPQKTLNEGNPSRLTYRSPMQWNSSTWAGFSDNETVDPWVYVPDTYTKYNVEVELNANSTSHLQLFKSLVDLRKTHSETIILGDTEFPVSNNSDIFVMSRHYKGYNGYLLAINLSPIERTVKLDDNISYLPPKGKIYLTDSQSSLDLKGTEINLSQFQLQPSQSILIEYSIDE